MNPSHRSNDELEHLIKILLKLRRSRFLQFIILKYTMKRWNSKYSCSAVSFMSLIQKHWMRLCEKSIELVSPLTLGKGFSGILYLPIFYLFLFHSVADTIISKTRHTVAQWTNYSSCTYWYNRIEIL